MRQFLLSPAAKQDLIEIGAYIASQSGSRVTARRFLEKIVSAFELLAANTEIGELRTEFATGLYRSFSVGMYVIYFKPAHNGVWIARLLHGARDHNSLL